MTKLEWTKKFYENLKATLIECGLFIDQKEADYCLEFHEDLNGEGPAISKNAGTFELLGIDVCVDMDRGKYVSVETPNDEFYMEVINPELMRPYS